MRNKGLNLARAWRPRRFDELVGQDLVVRLLQNSLYRSCFFPVYLLQGQRGCGKTSSARIFAAAINCQAYAQFVKDPQKHSLPCLACEGCQMMARAKHPDVIEIDAASHTGVDHVRQVIDAASFVPVYGQKRVYVIDEAHMLSKAAFNALLKMLEEPPLSVLFMLVTTDAHKIPDTIKSRCFHLQFSSLEPSVIVTYLSRICAEEKIIFDNEALQLIAHHADGAARDALNMVERMRLAHEKLTVATVRDVLGCLDDASCIRLFEMLFTGDSKQVLTTCIELKIKEYSASLLLKRLIEYLHGVMWVLHGIDAGGSGTRARFCQEIRPRGTRTLIIEMLSVCYAYETVIARSNSPHHVFEVVCVALCQLSGEKTTEEVPIQHASDKTPTSKNVAQQHAQKNSCDTDVSVAMPIKTSVRTPAKTEATGESLVKEEKPDAVSVSSGDASWDKLMHKIERLNDALVHSIFKQAAHHECDQEQRKLHLKFPRQLSFFSEWLENTRRAWQPLVHECFGSDMQAVFHFDVGQMKRPEVSNELVEPPVASTAISHTKRTRSTPRASSPSGAGGTPANLRDKEAWPQTHALLRMFPGVVSRNHRMDGTA